ncbi:winged helix domain-containing protein [Caulobacter henricii]|uniref:Winged helix domain-containing protein n=1 Tax=Caulobacter henricii TaxID=69395 RepID=A0A0P0NYX6_9CAUL|nr:hypothetical protein [Caulobacter henricii]ALL13040.1 hypothetical protein AQ619_06555 [Caulobacter henricii]
MSSPQNEMNPAATAIANGVRVANLQSGHPVVTTASRTEKPKLWVRIGVDGPDLLVGGREAQTLALLLTKEKAGFTSDEASDRGCARLTSAYIHKLRRLGMPIATDSETTAGGAVVAHYSLACPVTSLKQGRAEAA